MALGGVCSGFIRAILRRSPRERKSAVGGSGAHVMDVRSDAGIPDPGERATKAEQRIEQLRERRANLAAGEQPSQDSVDEARRHAEEAMDRAPGRLSRARRCCAST